jgi:BASS family bile acid:Na+ symporter
MLTPLETKLLGLMMAVIMLGMGASLTFKDFQLAFRRPAGVLVGLACQYGIMPLLGFALAVALDFPPALAIGVILMGCMPGGTTSNIFAYFSKSALALSIMMTSVSTLVAVAAVPILLDFYEGLAGLPSEFVIPASNVAQVLAILLVPTLIGIGLRRWNPNVGATIELIGGFLGVVVILFLIISWVPRNAQLLATTHWSVYLDPRRSRTIALETGIQNGPLAVLIVTLTFSGTMQQEVLLIPILYSLFIVLSSTVVTLWFRAITNREEHARDNAKVPVRLAAPA